MKNQNELIEPYRLFFPLGLFLALFAVFYWIMYNWGLLKFYPRDAHAQLMYFGFFWSFVAGFLMTAIPKMTGTILANYLEQSAGILLGFLQLILTLRNQIQYSKYIYLIQILFLIIFIVRRFVHFKKIPFEGFVFIPFAFLSSLLGWYLSWVNYINQSQFYKITADLFLLNLIFGLGARLIPVISRLDNALKPDQKAPLSKLKAVVFFATILNVSFIFDVFAQTRTSHLIVLTIVVLYIVFFLGYLKKPIQWSKLSIGLKIGLTFIVMGYCIKFLVPDHYPIAVSHFIYIGGLCLITLMIATRVKLAHGGVDLNYEVTSKRSLFIVVCLCTATLTRVASHAAISGLLINSSVILFISALILWGQKFYKIESMK